MRGGEGNSAPPSIPLQAWCKLLSIRYVLEPDPSGSKVTGGVGSGQVRWNPCRVLLTKLVNTSREFYTSRYPWLWVSGGFPNSPDVNGDDRGPDPLPVGDLKTPHPQPLPHAGRGEQEDSEFTADRYS